MESDYSFDVIKQVLDLSKCRTTFNDEILRVENTTNTNAFTTCYDIYITLNYFDVFNNKRINYLHIDYNDNHHMDSKKLKKPINALYTPYDETSFKMAINKLELAYTRIFE